MSSKRKINILGVTGSIGQSTVDVILSAPHVFDVGVITAHSNVEKLKNLSDQLNADHAFCTQEDGLEQLLSEPVDITVCAIMGFAGLKPLLKAIEYSDIVAIANKEPLVAAGDLILEACEKHNTKILPLDSEHNAIFQVFDNEQYLSIDKVILTASGGPFLNRSLSDVENVKPDEACAHPNWEMGRKISIDSATMMNKALEIIEARYLFDMPADNIDVLIHPQSVVHSMVSYEDGSVLAQMGASDMCTPIAYALAWPNRMKTPGQTLDLEHLCDLSFKKPDFVRFPALELAYKCLELGQGACIVLNAANEVAVSQFLDGKIKFGDIVPIVSYAVDTYKTDKSFKRIDDVLEWDTIVRSKVQTDINERHYA